MSNPIPFETIVADDPPAFACPKCNNHWLMVIVSAEARLWEDDDGNIQTEIEGDHDWDDHSPMRCGTCDYRGEAMTFKTQRIDDDMRVALTTVIELARKTALTAAQLNACATVETLLTEAE